MILAAFSVHCIRTYCDLYVNKHIKWLRFEIWTEIQQLRNDNYHFYSEVEAMKSSPIIISIITFGTKLACDARSHTWEQV